MDPKIVALLAFEPVPRKIEVEGGWTPELQREFIARLAVHGSANKACEEMGKNRTGMNKLYNNPQGASFRAAWHGAVALAKRRKAEAAAADFVRPGTRPPTLDNRIKDSPHPGPLPHRGEGEVSNEFGEWEDEDSLLRRAEEARDHISNKLLAARRLYLQSICDHPAKRAAFEILTDLPVDWDKAKRLEPQPDEPWRHVNMREPNMLMTAENGWMGDMTRGGADKKAELRKVIDEYWAKLGRPPIDWDGEDEGDED